jgi:hypothetical protein
MSRCAESWCTLEQDHAHVDPPPHTADELRRRVASLEAELAMLRLENAELRVQARLALPRRHRP